MRLPVIFLSSALSVLPFSMASASDAMPGSMLEKAHAGDVDAQYYLAFQYELGIDVEQDIQQAHYWYGKAAEQRDARSQYSLGYLYNEGIGVKQDLMLAKQWYEKSSQQNYAEAQYALAALYYNGIGVKADLERAKQFYGKACDGGQLEACEEYQKMQALGL